MDVREGKGGMLSALSSHFAKTTIPTKAGSEILCKTQVNLSVLLQKLKSAKNHSGIWLQSAMNSILPAPHSRIDVCCNVCPPSDFSLSLSPPT